VDQQGLAEQAKFGVGNHFQNIAEEEQSNQCSHKGTLAEILGDQVDGDDNAAGVGYGRRNPGKKANYDTGQVVHFYAGEKFGVL